MHKIVRSGLLACAALVAFAATTPAPVFAAEEVSLTIMDTDVPLSGMQVEVFFSDGSQSGITDDQGFVAFSVEYGRGYWVEVNGERIAEFFYIADGHQNVDLATAGTIDWPGR
jgi:hypothetical protein